MFHELLYNCGTVGAVGVERSTRGTKFLPILIKLPKDNCVKIAQRNFQNCKLNGSVVHILDKIENGNESEF